MSRKQEDFPQSPPYFRIDSSRERRQFMEKSISVWREVMYVNPPDSYAVSRMALLDDLDEVSEKYIHLLQNPGASLDERAAFLDDYAACQERHTAFRDEYAAFQNRYAAFFGALDASFQEHALLKAKSLRADANVRVFMLRANMWRECGIGPIRVHYYLSYGTNSALQDHFSAPPVDTARLKMGGFPLSPHHFGPETLASLYSGATDGRDWLAYDAYLSEILKCFGLSWLNVEDTILKVFMGKLPEAFKSELKGLPDALHFVLWKQDLQKWSEFALLRKRIDKKIKELSDLVQGTPLNSLYEPLINDLSSITQLPTWTANEGTIMDYSSQWSPITKAVTQAIANLLWEAAAQTKTFDEKCPRVFRTICSRAEIDTVRPLEFWMLVADLLYHLPIVRGLPDPLAERPLTANAIRVSIKR